MEQVLKNEKYVNEVKYVNKQKDTKKFVNGMKRMLMSRNVLQIC